MPSPCPLPSCAICAQPETSPFAKAVYHVCARLPAGTVATYGALAAAVGRPGAARAVGAALRRNVLNREGAMPRVPCHRVVRGDGAMGGFNGGGCERKREMLVEEGVRFREDGRVAAEVMSEIAGKLF
jgi:methylated-DNA-[protein]-cysteine S-methyltransferase